MRVRTVLLLGVLCACEDLEGDLDGDGFTVDAGDCDDADALIHPAAPDACDGVDNDCDSEIDEDAGLMVYTDSDGDGHGDPNQYNLVCTLGPGFSIVATDCNDGAAEDHPGAEEACDGRDNDCDGLFDEGVTVTYTRDLDLDGHGDATIGAPTQEGCDTAPSGFAASADDCDDANANVHPGAPELCDDLDNDCLNGVDVDAIDVLAWYQDRDGDGFGNAQVRVWACDAPVGFVYDDTDCLDGAAGADVHPGADEWCNEVDDDCDDAVDEDAVDAATAYPDDDGDGFGSAWAAGDVGCDLPSKLVADHSDCDDSAKNVHPGGDEVCDADDVDEDCNGLADDDDSGVSGREWSFADRDLDGFGDPADTGTRVCDPPPGRVFDNTDCDETLKATHPGATEECNGRDDDCDTEVDEEAVDAVVWFADSDEDGFGDPETSTEACETPEGHVSDDTDCLDTSNLVHPGADERCGNSIDDDCDDQVDEADAVDALAAYPDGDGDGFGDEWAAAVAACVLPAGHLLDHSDCDDDANTVHPGADEVCDDADVDEDCDGFSDDEDTAVSGRFWTFPDLDGDGFGDLFDDGTRSCDPAPGRVEDHTDCNDALEAVNTDALERCNTYDDDCDEEVDEDDAEDASPWFADTDGDTFGDDTTEVLACRPDTTWVDRGGDCAVDDIDVHPDAVEVCDGIDNNCVDGIDEPTAHEAPTWYIDVDADDYGADSFVACDTDDPAAVPLGGDCDELDIDVNPGADELCDGIDNDCDEQIDEDDAVDAPEWFADGDSDDIGGALVWVRCDDPLDGTIPLGGDCNDENPDVLGPPTWYEDTDGDLYAGDTSTVLACEDPGDDWYAEALDCDDTNADIHPGADEHCDTFDENCNDIADEDPVGAATWYWDGDGDGYGVPSPNMTACAQPGGYADNDDDCKDDDAEQHPGVIWYKDGDLDDYGLTNTTQASCLKPDAFWASVPGDCNDSSYSDHPGGVERCFNASGGWEGKDNDCDLSTDEDCPTRICGNVVEDTTWAKNTYGYFVACSMNVQSVVDPVLTIEDGVTVYFHSGVTFGVGTADGAGGATTPEERRYGSLVIDGHTDGVLFTAYPDTMTPDPVPGDWGGMRFGTFLEEVSISGLTLEYATTGILLTGKAESIPVIEDTAITDTLGDAIYGWYEGTLTLRDTTIDGCGGDGIDLIAGYIVPTDSSATGIEITGCAGFPARLRGPTPGAFGLGNSFHDNGTNRVEVTGADGVSQDADWYPLGAPYWFSDTYYPVEVGGSTRPLLTIHDGVDIESAGASLRIGYYGAADLVIDGHTEGVRMTSDDATKARGQWGGLSIHNTATYDIDGLTLEYSGTGAAGLNVYATGAGTVENSTIANNKNRGVYVEYGFPDLVQNVIESNESYGVGVAYWTRLGAFSGNTIRDNGNVVDFNLQDIPKLASNTLEANQGVIRVEAATTTYRQITADFVLPDYGHPYVVEGTILVGGTDAPTLTIEDGVELRMNEYLGIGSGGPATLVIEDVDDQEDVLLRPHDGIWAWSGIHLYDPSEDNVLAGFTVRGAFPGLYVYDNSEAVLADCRFENNIQFGIRSDQDLNITDCTITGTVMYGGSGDGLYLPRGDSLAVLEDVTITGSGGGGVAAPADVTRFLGSGDFSGNTLDGVRVLGGVIVEDTVWDNRFAAPWRIVGTVEVHGSAVPTLEIRDTTVRIQGVWDALTAGRVSPGGDLVIDGSTIESTSTTSYFGNVWLYPYANFSSITSSTLRYGGYGNTPGIVVVNGGDVDITDNTFTNSLNYGIYCANGTRATITGNTFSFMATANTLNCP